MNVMGVARSAGMFGMRFAIIIILIIGVPRHCGCDGRPRYPGWVIVRGRIHGHLRRWGSGTMCTPDHLGNTNCGIIAITDNHNRQCQQLPDAFPVSRTSSVTNERFATHTMTTDDLWDPMGGMMCGVCNT